MWEKNENYIIFDSARDSIGDSMFLTMNASINQ